MRFSLGPKALSLYRLLRDCSEIILALSAHTLGTQTTQNTLIEHSLHWQRAPTCQDLLFMCCCNCSGEAEAKKDSTIAEAKADEQRMEAKLSNDTEIARWEFSTVFSK